MKAQLRQTIETIYPKIDNLLLDEVKQELRRAPKKALEDYCLRFGMMFRLKFLGENKILYRCFVSHGIHDREEMLRQIIRCYHQYLRDKGRQRTAAQ